MEDGGDGKLRNTFWLVLPFIITSCFIILMVRYGLNSGEEGSFWVIFLPGVTLCIFPWAKIAALGFQTCAKARTFRITKEMYESNPELSELKNRGKAWGVITLLTWIVVFLFMMVGVGFFNAAKSENEPTPSASEQGDTREVPLVSDHSEGKAEISGKDVPLAFIENSNVHKRVQFYDNLIYRLILMPFLAMLAGAIFLIRALIGRWWNWKRVPLGWKIVPCGAIACFVLPIALVFAVSGPMTTTVRTETLRFLNSLPDNAIVIINGKGADDPSDVISKLATLATAQAHHSHPTERIRIQVLGSDYSLTLELARDSGKPSEYWVFYPGYRHTRLNEVGRITTNIFDSFQVSQ